MLEITVEPITMFNQETQEFVAVGPKKPVKLHLEHSLISLSKWEEQTRRKFFSKEECPQTKEDYLFYIKCMSLDGPIKDDILTAITNSQLIEIINYIQSDRSATTIKNNRSTKHSSEILTSELLYYYLAVFHLPFSAEKWHLSRLLKLIAIANAKENPGKKIPKKQILMDNSKLNKARRAALHSNG